MGKIHLKLLREVEGLELAGFYDPSDENAEAAVAAFQVKRFTSPDELLSACDAVDVVSPTGTHSEVALRAIAAGRHVFVEKPLAATVDEARALTAALNEKKLCGMVGHVERFNPAFLALQHHHLQPLFIEVHRLAQFNPRGTDVSVVFDLMVHDLDIVLSMVKAEVTEVRSSGVAVISSSPDIANARLQFADGCVANLTASRISMKQMRKMRVFQHNAYISMDFMKQKSDVFHISNTPPADDGGMFPPMEIETADAGKKYLQIEIAEMKDHNAIRYELEMFRDCIRSGNMPAVSFADGMRVMQVADSINRLLG